MQLFQMKILNFAFYLFMSKIFLFGLSTDLYVNN